MSGEGHPIAGAVFLILAVGTIGLGAYTGISASRGHHGEAPPPEEHHAPPEMVEKAEDDLVLGHINEAIAKIGEEQTVEGKREQLLQAITVLENVVREHPEHKGALYNLGVAQSAYGFYQDAAATFDKLLSLDPNDWEAVAEMAALQFAMFHTAPEPNQALLDQAFELLGKIPVGEARMKTRLGQDQLWDSVENDPRFIALLKKHGVTRKANTASASARAP